MRRPLAVLLAAMLSATVAAGCGAGAGDTAEFEGEEAKVAEVVEDLQAAADEDEARRVCTDLLAREVAQQLGDRCTEAIDQAFDEADTSQLAVEDVRISGTTARARVSTGTDDEDEELVELVREGNVWRIARFAGPVEG
jgi:hypothetical protein